MMNDSIAPTEILPAGNGTGVGSGKIARPLKWAGPGKPRILLCGVFKPYGVDDAYGRKENIMELFHNQVTKAQGIASLRFHHRSFGLYFLAENVSADVVVLDFSTRRQFLREIRRGYDLVGISFITPNFLKARQMAAWIRQYAPRSLIVLGGHGAAIEGVEERIECDAVVRGEGIGWLRSFVGDPVDAPLKHPILGSSEVERIFGVATPDPKTSLLVPGVGCVNGCNFCSTTHFFGKTYTPFLKTGRDLFECACRIADARKTDTFFVMDENFLKEADRAHELLDLMIRHRRWFQFHLFSSADTVKAFGVENLVRMGVNMLWIGFESQNGGAYAKNQGIDARAMVADLRGHGIHVLASGILCLEHHTPQTIQQDIDFLIGLKADWVQFMLLTGLPVTGLYSDHKARGLLRDELPFEEWHGQHVLNFRHPAFSDAEAKEWLDRAFRLEFESNGTSIFRMIQTVHNRYRYFAGCPATDEVTEARRRLARAQLIEFSQILPVIMRYAPDPAERDAARNLDRELQDVSQPATLKYTLTRAFVPWIACFWKWRCKLFGDQLQPATIRTEYRCGSPIIS